MHIVALQKDSVTVGHIFCAILCMCTLLLRHGGVFLTEPWKHSGDLPQGELKLLCTY